MRIFSLEDVWAKSVEEQIRSRNANKCSFMLFMKKLLKVLQYTDVKNLMIVFFCQMLAGSNLNQKFQIRLYYFKVIFNINFNFNFIVNFIVNVSVL